MSFASRLAWLCLLSCMVAYVLCADDEVEQGQTAETPEEAPPENTENAKEPEPLKNDEEEDGKDSDDREFTEEELRQIHTAVDENVDQKMSHAELMKFTEKHHRHVELSGGYLDDELSRLDKDKNGLVSLEEYLNDTNPEGSEKESETELFKAADKDGDGQLNKDELSGLLSPEAEGPVMTAMLDISMKKTDANSDGKVTLEEFRNADLHHSDRAPLSGDDDSGGDDGSALFKRLDANSDGVLEKSELYALHSGEVAREAVVNEFVKELDKNGDHHVDAQELIEAKETVQDSDLQSYLIAWAMHRPVIGR